MKLNRSTAPRLFQEECLAVWVYNRKESGAITASLSELRILLAKLTFRNENWWGMKLRNAASALGNGPPSGNERNLTEIRKAEELRMSDPSKSIAECMGAFKLRPIRAEFATLFGDTVPYEQNVDQIVQDYRSEPSNGSSDRLSKLFDQYGAFVKGSEYDEIYKWQIAKTVQDNWDLDAPDLATMIDRSFSHRHQNLWSGQNFLPKRMLLEWAKRDAADCRLALRQLIHGEAPLADRMRGFAEHAKRSLMAARPDKELSTYQDVRAMSLWLGMVLPEKFYLYKASTVSGFIQRTGHAPLAKPGDKYTSIDAYYELCEEVRALLLARPDIVETHRSIRDDSCHADTEHHLLVQDFIYFVAERPEPIEGERPVHYWLFAPGPNATYWNEFQEKGIMALGWDELGDFAQFASVAEVADELRKLDGTTGSKKNDANAVFDLVNTIAVGDVIIAKRGREEYLGYGIVDSEHYYDEGRAAYKNCRPVNWKHTGSWPEVEGPIVMKTLTDITKYPDYVARLTELIGIDGATGSPVVREPNYWVFQGNPKYYDAAGALRAGAAKSWTVTAHQGKIRPGDKAIIWVTGPQAGCYALATITSDVVEMAMDEADRVFVLDQAQVLKQKRARIRVEHELSQRPVGWTAIKDLPSMADFKGGNQGTTFTATKEQYDAILQIAIPNNRTMRDPLNKILYGPPGTGKTYKLKAEYFGRYTTHVEALTREQRLTEMVQPLTWWEVVAMVLLDLGPSKTSAIMDHELLRTKAALSNSANVRATVWGTLQMHTVTECELVKYTNRQEPLVFNKKEDSIWEVLPAEADALVPELRVQLKHTKQSDAPGAHQIKRYEFITFHQSFSYEDFIEGIKPGLKGEEFAYDIVPGVFKQLCSRAEKDPANDYAIFIDEINRGNVSAIFGELISLIEEDKRAGMPHALSVLLPYSKRPFSVPPNLHIIGTMNTADRSVEALDTALRRRFSFEECPADHTKLTGLNVGEVALDVLLQVINARIEMLLDRDHHIGHSYFMNWADADKEQKLRQVFKNNIIPLLKEYFYGDPVKVGMVLGPAFVQELNGKENQVWFAKGFKAGEDIEPKPRYAFTDPTDATLVPLKAFLDICDGK